MSRSRNAKCSCGSGKKYKLCHGRREPRVQKRSKATVGLAILSALAMAMVGIYSALDSRGEDNPGRVWSAEHGHWHDAAGGELGGSSPGGPGPGKVWSPEHNHFH